jgi:hypothetical protein
MRSCVAPRFCASVPPPTCAPIVMQCARRQAKISLAFINVGPGGAAIVLAPSSISLNRHMSRLHVETVSSAAGSSRCASPRLSKCMSCASNGPDRARHHLCAMMATAPAAETARDRHQQTVDPAIYKGRRQEDSSFKFSAAGHGSKFPPSPIRRPAAPLWQMRSNTSTMLRQTSSSCPKGPRMTR